MITRGRFTITMMETQRFNALLMHTTACIEQVDYREEIHCHYDGNTTR